VSLKGRAAGQHVLLVIVQPIVGEPEPGTGTGTGASSRSKYAAKAKAKSKSMSKTATVPELLVYSIQAGSAHGTGDSSSSGTGMELSSTSGPSLSLELRHSLEGASHDGARILAGCFHKQMLCLSLFWEGGAWTQHRFRLRPGWFS